MKPIIITLPNKTQILVRIEDNEVLVDLREETWHTWMPIDMAGGSVEVRTK